MRRIDERVPDVTLRPTASPTDQFVAPASAESMVGPAPAVGRAPEGPTRGPNEQQQFAQAMSKYGPLMIFSPALGSLLKGMQDLADPIIKNSIETQAMQGKLMVENSQKTFADLVASGEISEADNPWKIWSAKKASGTLHANRYNRLVAVAYEDWLAKNPDADEMAIEGFLQEQSGLYLNQNNVRDNTEMLSFHTGRRQSHQQVTAKHVSHVNQRRTEKINQAFIVDTINLAEGARELEAQLSFVKQSIDPSIKDPGFKRFSDAAQEKVNTSENEYLGKWQALLDEQTKIYGNVKANEKVFTQLTALASDPETRSPLLLKVIEKIESGGAPYASTEKGRAILTRARPAIDKASITLSQKEQDIIARFVIESPSKGLDNLLEQLKIGGLDTNNLLVRNSVLNQFSSNVNAAAQTNAAQKTAISEYAKSIEGGKVPSYDDWQELWTAGGTLSVNTGATAQQRSLLSSRASYESFVRSNYPHGTMPSDLQEMVLNPKLFSSANTVEALDAAHEKAKREIETIYGDRLRDPSGALNPEVESAFRTLQNTYIARLRFVQDTSGNKQDQDIAEFIESLGRMHGTPLTIPQVRKAIGDEFGEDVLNSMTGAKIVTYRNEVNKGFATKSETEQTKDAKDGLTKYIQDSVGRIPSSGTPDKTRADVESGILDFFLAAEEKKSQTFDATQQQTIDTINASEASGDMTKEEAERARNAAYKVRNHMDTAYKNTLFLGGAHWSIEFQDGNLIGTDVANPARKISVNYVDIIEQETQKRTDNDFSSAISTTRNNARKILENKDSTENEKLQAKQAILDSRNYEKDWVSQAMLAHEKYGVFPTEYSSWINAGTSARDITRWGVPRSATEISDNNRADYERYLSLQSKQSELTDEEKKFMSSVPASFVERTSQLKSINNYLSAYRLAVEQGKVDQTGMSDSDIEMFNDIQWMQISGDVRTVGGSSSFMEGTLGARQADLMFPELGSIEQAGRTYGLANISPDGNYDETNHPADRNRILGVKKQFIENGNELSYWLNKMFRGLSANGQFTGQQARTAYKDNFVEVDLYKSSRPGRTTYVMLKADYDAILKYDPSIHLDSVIKDNISQDVRARMANVKVGEVLESANTNLERPSADFIDAINIFGDAEGSTWLLGHLETRLLQSNQARNQEEARDMIENGYIVPSTLSQTSFLAGKSPSSFQLKGKDGNIIMQITNQEMIESYWRSNSALSAMLEEDE